MNIIITGGSSGIGRETALYLANDRNNQIIITGRRENEMRAVEELAGYGNISFYVLDLLQLDKELPLFKEYISSRFSVIDILINNAGSLIKKEFTELTDSDLQQMMTVNYFAPATLIRSLAGLMHQGSHILNLSSMGGFQGSTKFKGLSGYSASKAAIACLTECLAGEFSERGISVNCIAPGSVDTEMLNIAFPGYKAQLSAPQMGEMVGKFAIEGHKYFNGKILPVSFTAP